MIEKIKDNIHVLILLNILLSTILLLSSKRSEVQLTILGNTKEEKENHLELKKTICKKAFSSFKSGNFSKDYMHPDIIEFVSKKSSQTYQLENISNFYFKMNGRDICKVIIKHNKGFSSFDAVISNDGPLFYRLTSIIPRKPTYKEVKEFL